MNKTTIIASAVALALGLSACSEQKSLEQLLASASEHSAKRDFSSAVIELKNAVRMAPKSAQARIALGKAYLEQGNYVFAEKELEKSQQLGIDPASIIPLLAQVKAKLAKPEAVYQLVEISGDLADDDYIVVLTYAGITALAHNDTDKGQDYIGQAIAISETAAYSQVGKAYLARSTQDYAQSLVDIENLLQDNPHLSEALLLKAHLLFGLEDYEQAAGSFASYLTQHPMDYSVRYFEINSLIKAELFEQAEVITDKLLAKFKSAPLALHYKAQLQYQKSLYKEAKANAEQAIQAGSTSAVTKLIAGASAYQLKDYEQAYNHLKPIEGFLPNSHPVKKILAVIKLQLGYSSEAAESFIALEGLTNDDSAFLQVSSSRLMAIGDFESAQKLIEKAEKLDPDNAQLSAQKGFVLLSQNNNEGIQSLERAIELDPSLINVDLALAIQYLKAGDDKKARTIAQELISEHNENPSGYLLQGVIYAKDENFDKAMELFKKALSIAPENIASLYNLALLYTDINKTELAFLTFEQLLAISPEHREALIGFVKLAIKNDQLIRSRDYLIKLYDSQSLALTFALAQNYRLNKQVEDAIELLEEFPNEAMKNTLFWSTLGDSYLQQENFEKAKVAFAEGLKKSPEHYLLNLRYIGTLEALQQYSKALTQTRKAYGVHSNNDRLEVLLAYFEAKNNNFEAAKSMLDIVKAKQSKHYLIDSVQGQIALVNKNYNQAIEHFSESYNKKSTADNAFLLARSLMFNGQQTEAERVLETFIEKNPTKLTIRLMLANLYRENDRSKKIEQYLVINKYSPNNFTVLNNLAWNQYKLGQIDDALVNLEHAYKLVPSNLSVLESYGVVLVASQQYEKAVEILELAIVKGSKDENVEQGLVRAKTALSQ
ncbi:hypothetical protein A9Q74_02785 [Colwellia sp. 39_35_sub15_T18]|nr:hypothetical protein A9Q74_02785 [Colwellia sp. 39_35_sub15_T18]